MQPAIFIPGDLGTFFIIFGTVVFIVICIFKACPQAGRSRAIPRGFAPNPTPEPVILKVKDSTFADYAMAAHEALGLDQARPVMIRAPRVSQ